MADSIEDAVAEVLAWIDGLAIEPHLAFEDAEFKECLVQRLRPRQVGLPE